MYLYDYHMHSLYSPDGRSTISELCVSAIASGMKEIAITDHFEPTPGDETYSYYNAKSYFFDILLGNTIFDKKLKIKFGVELGQPHLFPESSEKLIETNSYDYVLGSAHKMVDGKDFSEVIYTKDNLSTYCNVYLDELKALAKWNKFDCLGHLDLVKRYAALYDLKVNLMEYRERLEEILKIVISNGKGIEVNTSGLRQSSGECLPGLDIIKLYKELGGEIITVGSDSHISSDVGKGISEAIKLVQLAGFDYMTVFTNRQPTMIKISDHSKSFPVNKKSA